MNTQDKIYYLEQIAMAADRLVSESADHSVDYWTRMQRIATLMQRLEDTVKEYKRDAGQDAFGPQLKNTQSKIISDLRRANDGLIRALDGHVSEALGIAYETGHESGKRLGQLMAEHPVDWQSPRNCLNEDRACSAPNYCDYHRGVVEAKTQQADPCPCDTCTINEGHEEECQGMAIADRHDCSYGYIRWLAAKMRCKTCGSLPHGLIIDSLYCLCDGEDAMSPAKWIAKNGASQ